MSGSTQAHPIRPVVSNSGPLIALAAIGRLNLLCALFGQIVIPPAVYQEVVIRGQGEPGSAEVKAATWIKVAQVQDHLAVNLLREVLDAGESEAIVLAQELNARYVLLDDALARRKARLIGLPMTGTLGLTLIAKESGLVSAVKLVLDELRQTEFRMSEQVFLKVLTKAGETSSAPLK
jgi:predicted nucleic acid-binding protein